MIGVLDVPMQAASWVQTETQEPLLRLVPSFVLSEVNAADSEPS